MLRTLGIVALLFLCIGVASGWAHIGCVAVQAGAACGVFLPAAAR